MSADDDHFITPPTPGPPKDYSENDVYERGETVTLSWVKSFPTGTLTLTQDNKPGDPTGGPKNMDFSEYEWIVDYYALDPSVNNVFYFGFGGSGQAFTSHYFNITDNANSGPADDPGPSTSSTSTTTTTLGSTTTTASMFSSTVSPSSAISTTSTSPLPTDTGSPTTESLSAGGITGIAVGVTLGTILVVAGLGFLVWRTRNKRRAPVNPTHDASQYPYPQVLMPVGQPQQLMPTPVVEMEGVQKRNGHHEMP
ncbi:hypothetical protein O1611_g1149 [Lasiodiplodia mahajangana]|uniref:Uncharacterized protein n=1 Tax=Lasiodiplodia mahajangana TaxID=1108764 RepID=A0ACC2JY81_9PEZI|nr:hypothetical protein O1611_g1149 [Lasiodiplodia mahajangana]